MQMIVPAASRIKEGARLRLGAERKENGKTRAVPDTGSAAQPDGAAMFGNNAPTHPKSQPSALLSLGGVKGAEQIDLDFGINARPIIRNYDANAAFGQILPICRLVYMYFQLGPGDTQSVDRVSQQVGNDLPQLA